MTSAQISESMAFDQLRSDDDFKQRCKLENMTLEERIQFEMNLGV